MDKDNPAAFAVPDAAITELRGWLADSLTSDGAMRGHLTHAFSACADFTGYPLGDETWSSLPDGLRHGIIRHAANIYRDGSLQPTAASLALWRPWRGSAHLSARKVNTQ